MEKGGLEEAGGSFVGVVEVVGVMFRGEDGCYAVLRVCEAESGEGFALVGAC